MTKSRHSRAPRHALVCAFVTALVIVDLWSDVRSTPTVAFGADEPEADRPAPLALVHAARIEVRRSDGPAVGASVHLAWQPDAGEGWAALRLPRTGVTDTTGSVAFEDLPPGVWTAEAWSADGEDVGRCDVRSPGSVGDPHRLVLAPASRHSLRILDASGRPVAGVTFDVAGRPGWTARPTSVDGWTSVPFAPGIQRLTLTRFRGSGWNDVSTPPWSTELSVGRIASTLALPAARTLQYPITGERAPSDGADIDVLDPDGRPLLGRIEGSQVVVDAVRVADDDPVLVAVLADGRRATLVGGPGRERPTAFVAWRTVDVVVRDTSDRPVAHVGVSARDLGWARTRLRSRGVTDADGVATLLVPPHVPLVAYAMASPTSKSELVLLGELAPDATRLVGRTPADRTVSLRVLDAPHGGAGVWVDAPSVLERNAAADASTVLLRYRPWFGESEWTLRVQGCEPTTIRNPRFRPDELAIDVPCPPRLPGGRLVVRMRRPWPKPGGHDPGTAMLDPLDLPIDGRMPVPITGDGVLIESRLAPGRWRVTERGSGSSAVVEVRRGATTVATLDLRATTLRDVDVVVDAPFSAVVERTEVEVVGDHFYDVERVRADGTVRLRVPTDRDVRVSVAHPLLPPDTTERDAVIVRPTDTDTLRFVLPQTPAASVGIPRRPGERPGGRRDRCNVHLTPRDREGATLTVSARVSAVVIGRGRALHATHDQVRFPFPRPGRYDVEIDVDRDAPWRIADVELGHEDVDLGVRDAASAGPQARIVPPLDGLTSEVAEWHRSIRVLLTPLSRPGPARLRYSTDPVEGLAPGTYRVEVYERGRLVSSTDMAAEVP